MFFFPTLDVLEHVRGDGFAGESVGLGFPFEDIHRSFLHDQR